MKELGKMSRQQAFADRVAMIEIDDEDAGQRIDNFLLRVCKGVPKSHVYRILRSGEVRVNKGRIDATYRLVCGDIVRVPPVRTATNGGQDGVDATLRNAYVPPAQFPILFEDPHLLVIDKPAGVAVHGGSGVSHGVIEQLRAARPDARFLELVHRLDRETSGILMLAKKRAALTHLHAQLRENKTDKRYLACVRAPEGGWRDMKRVVKAPLHKYVNAEGERRVSVDPEGQAAHTVFTLMERFRGPDTRTGDADVRLPAIAGAPDGFVLVEAQLKTGRTHQIRVHLAHLDAPIAGDDKYGDFALNKALARANATPGLKRMFLHAAKLRITHPASGEMLQLEAALPAECQRFLVQLRAAD
ncbi:pseudouridine synthase [Robbsia andropogonis]|uniref:pseudouridine synthase n=1 Tax=Robbsia andropogonis TaxID=28092 RepID=UPI000463C7B1|nr:pseudouridine synthase [Robbsia andropogonis]